MKKKQWLLFVIYYLIGVFWITAQTRDIKEPLIISYMGNTYAVREFLEI